MEEKSISFKHLRIGSSCVRLEWDASIPNSFVSLLYAPWEIEDIEPEYTISVTSRDDMYYIDSPRHIVY